MANKKFRKTTDKGIAMRFQIARGLTNSEISKILGVQRSLIRYYHQRPEKLKVKRAKLPKINKFKIKNYINPNYSILIYIFKLIQNSIPIPQSPYCPIIQDTKILINILSL